MCSDTAGGNSICGESTEHIVWASDLIFGLALCSAELSWEQTPLGRSYSSEQSKLSFLRGGRMTCTKQWKQCIRKWRFQKCFAEERGNSWIHLVAHAVFRILMVRCYACKNLFLLFWDEKEMKIKLFHVSKSLYERLESVTNGDRASSFSFPQSFLDWNSILKQPYSNLKTETDNFF